MHCLDAATCVCRQKLYHFQAIAIPRASTVQGIVGAARAMVGQLGDVGPSNRQIQLGGNPPLAGWGLGRMQEVAWPIRPIPDWGGRFD